MTGKTHLIGGAATAALLITGGAEVSVAMVGACLTGSLLPDIDHFHSKISNQNIGTKVASGLIGILFGHRGFTHTPIFIALVGAFMYILTKDIPELMFASSLVIPLCCGMLSHLILDTLNPMGILWAWPLSKKYINIASIRTGSAGEFIVASLMSAALLAAGIKELTPFLASIL